MHTPYELAYPEAMDLTRWRMNRKYGNPWHEPITTALSAFWERFRLCRVQRKHLVKMGSHGACYRCGKVLR